MLDEWLGDMRAVRGLRRATIRCYASSVSTFCRYVADPAYGWAPQCLERFGTHPVQVAHEWNTAVHAAEPGTATGAAGLPETNCARPAAGWRPRPVR